MGQSTPQSKNKNQWIFLIWQFFEASFTEHKLCHFKDLQNIDFLEHSKFILLGVIGMFHEKFLSCILTETKFMECTYFNSCIKVPEETYLKQTVNADGSVSPGCLVIFKKFSLCPPGNENTSISWLIVEEM